MLPAILHKELLLEIADRLQLPSFKNSERVERGNKILHFKGSQELAQAVTDIQQTHGKPYPARKHMNDWLKNDKLYPGAAKKYGFGAIVFETSWEVVMMSQDRERMNIYVNRLVPGGFLIIDCDQFKNEAGIQLTYSLMRRLKPEIAELSTVDPRIMHEDPLMRIKMQLEKPLKRTYLIGQKPQ